MLKTKELETEDTDHKQDENDVLKTKELETEHTDKKDGTEESVQENGNSSHKQDSEDSSSQHSPSEKDSQPGQVHIDSSSSSGYSSDNVQEHGWESEGAKKRRLRHERRQTKVIETSDGMIGVRTVGIVKRVPRERQYTCYICDKVLEMQTSFTNHMKEEHPDSPYQCDFCPKTLLSANGLFKHQRSHQYLKHQCDECGKWFQFPGQLKKHMKLHTKQNMYPCLHCDRQFTDNSTMLIHTRTHNTALKCKLCPKNTEKTYNSQYTLDQHQRGMHSDGWTSFCGEKWKSKYSRLLKKCTKCAGERERRKKARYLFEL